MRRPSAVFTAIAAVVVALFALGASVPAALAQGKEHVNIDTPKDRQEFSIYVPPLAPLTIPVSACDNIFTRKVKLSVGAGSASNTSFAGSPTETFPGDRVCVAQNLTFSPDQAQADQELEVVIVATATFAPPNQSTVTATNKVTIKIKTVGVKAWSDGDHALAWTDFQGPVPNAPKDDAETFCKINWHISDDVKSEFNSRTSSWDATARKGIKTRAVFVRKQSWVTKKSDQTLHHEQGHFNICEIYRRKLDKKLKDLLGGLEGKGSAATQPEAEKAALADLAKKVTKKIEDDVTRAIKDHLNACDAKQREYDREHGDPPGTHHSQDQTAQQAWDTQIEKSLNNQPSSYFPDP